MIEYKTDNFGSEEIRQAVRIQMQELSGGFLSSLGEEPLTLLFTHAATDPQSILVIATDPGEGQVVGYVFGTSNVAQFYRSFVFEHILSASLLILPKILSWKRMKSALETLFYPIKNRRRLSESCKAELLDLAVSRDYQGVGVGAGLFGEFVDQCKGRAITAFQIPTTESLHRAHRFYEKRGARRVAATRVHAEEETYIYQYDIEERT